MARPEATLSANLLKNLRQFGNTHSVIRIESGLTMRGIPDINYCFSEDKHGWIELKCIPNFPVNKTSLPKYKPEQRLFARRRCKAGEKVFFLLQVNLDYFLFMGDEVPKYVSKKDMFKLCRGHWHGSIDYYELYDLL